MKKSPLLFFFLIQSVFAKTWNLDQIILQTLENSRSIQIIQTQKQGDPLIKAEALAPFDWQVGWNHTLPKSIKSNNFDMKKFNSNFSLQKKMAFTASTLKQTTVMLQETALADFLPCPHLIQKPCLSI